MNFGNEFRNFAETIKRARMYVYEAATLSLGPGKCGESIQAYFSFLDIIHEANLKSAKVKD